MKSTIQTIGFGGGCHWCTEAVFQTIKGVKEVQQGYIASSVPNDTYSEGVIVTFDTSVILLEALINIHIHTHHSWSNHDFRDRYRSAVYWFEEGQKIAFAKALSTQQLLFEEKIITQALPFITFRPSRESIQEYYIKNPEAPFCKRYIQPKLNMLKTNFKEYLVDDGNI